MEAGCLDLRLCQEEWWKKEIEEYFKAGGDPTWKVKSDEYLWADCQTSYSHLFTLATSGYKSMQSRICTIGCRAARHRFRLVASSSQQPASCWQIVLFFISQQHWSWENVTVLTLLPQRWMLLLRQLRRGCRPVTPLTFYSEPGLQRGDTVLIVANTAVGQDLVTCLYMLTFRHWPVSFQKCKGVTVGRAFKPLHVKFECVQMKYVY